MQEQSRAMIIEGLNLLVKNSQNSITAGVDAQNVLLELGQLIKFKESHEDCEKDKPEE